MDIRERFQRPEWLSRREAEIERAEGMCESCEATGELEVLVPFLSASRNPWDYPEGSYRVFCPSCMQSHRTLESRAREALSQLGTPNWKACSTHYCSSWRCQRRSAPEALSAFTRQHAGNGKRKRVIPSMSTRQVAT
jgi:hypothetical protein